ncbi:dihydropteroate synthase [Aggregicoccus sp. 17bor-14]|uniref:dihydropteroate synthase n=1 Tax=Myxococcaceae TaxID=31 RepID=UPI00129C6129|nr:MULTISPECIES: dihydropteroate synthase [Myxococcaceae]MBF5044179.1 dihydropteroate synthase [Simulacricoccus sp. 17bor-14]MRI89929.1 dihydropteroate synthase [Aggregicoccus sp. 17bor-14]
MIRARILSADAPSTLQLGFARLGLPRAAGEYLLEKLPHLQLLLTGLEREQGRFLKALREGSVAPGFEEFPDSLSGDQERRPGTALLSGRREQLLRLVDAAREAPGQQALAAAVQRALDALSPPPPLRLGARDFALGERTWVMGVVNVTADSFSDGGRFLAPEAAVAHGLALAAAGAHVLDVGGESTRPGSEPISADEECARVVPVLQALRERTEVPLSVDTTKAQVAREALRAGAVLVNDISGLSWDPAPAPALARAVAEAGAALCVMHLQGTPATMQQQPRYEDVVEEVLDFLERALARAEHAGVAPGQLLVDPGIGFGKTVGHNLFLLRRLPELRALGRGVLVGTSRKGFLGALTGRKRADERLAATLGSVAAVAAGGGADFVRVHDVAEARDALAVADALREAQEGGALYETVGKRAPPP